MGEHLAQSRRLSRRAKATQSTVSAHARGVGRVGALAVALGHRGRPDLDTCSGVSQAIEPRNVLVNRFFGADGSEDHGGAQCRRLQKRVVIRQSGTALASTPEGSTGTRASATGDNAQAIVLSGNNSSSAT